MHRNRIHHREFRGGTWTSCWWRSSLVHVTQREVRSHDAMWQCRPLCSRQDQYFSFAEDLCVYLPKIWNSFTVCNRNRHLCLIYFHKKEKFMKPIPSIEVVFHQFWRLMIWHLIWSIVLLLCNCFIRVRERWQVICDNLFVVSCEFGALIYSF